MLCFLGIPGQQDRGFCTASEVHQWLLLHDPISSVYQRVYSVEYAQQQKHLHQQEQVRRATEGKFRDQERQDVDWLQEQVRYLGDRLAAQTVEARAKLAQVATTLRETRRENAVSQQKARALAREKTAAQQKIRALIRDKDAAQQRILALTQDARTAERRLIHYQARQAHPPKTEPTTRSIFMFLRCGFDSVLSHAGHPHRPHPCWFIVRRRLPLVHLAKRLL